MPTQSLLLPCSPMDWLPQGHLAYFILDVVDQLDLSEIEAAVQASDPRGTRPYSPAMMMALLVYGYCVGVRSSRKIERATYEDVAFRVLAGGNHPDHTRISEFRRVHQRAFRGLFTQVLQLCQKAGLVKLGRVAIDGTKVQANASKHKAMSYERMVKTEKRLEREVERLMAEAEKVDAEEDARYGVGRSEEDLPEELRRREQRLEKIRQAKAALETEARVSRAKDLKEQAARAREGAERTASERVRKGQLTRAARAEAAAVAVDDSEPAPPSGGGGGLPEHRVRTTPAGQPHPKAQRNFTDPDSRIMESSGVILQGFNCQAAVDGSSQVVLAAEVTNQAPDNGNLMPMIEQVRNNCGAAPAIVTADSGYWAPSVPAAAAALGTDAYIATERRRHWDCDDTITQGEPPEGDDTRETMRWKLRTVAGRKIYAERKCIAEPVFGRTKEQRQFRRFLLRGLASARAEWTLICATHNLLKLFAVRSTAIPC
jgi:transposase